MVVDVGDGRRKEKSQVAFNFDGLGCCGWRFVQHGARRSFGKTKMRNVLAGTSRCVQPEPRKTPTTETEESLSPTTPILHLISTNTTYLLIAKGTHDIFHTLFRPEIDCPRRIINSNPRLRRLRGKFDRQTISRTQELTIGLLDGSLLR